MAKLYFKYGTMGSGKSLDLIRTYYNYKERGLKPYCFNSGVDTRSKENYIESRTGDKLKAKTINTGDDIKQLFSGFFFGNCSVILIDESQFLTAKHIDDIKDFIMEKDISVLCYGLKTNFTSKLFDGSKRLIEISDVQEEIKGICWCGKKATQNARVVNGNVVYTGEEIQIGGNESYTPLCFKHYREGKLKADIEK